LEDVQQPGRLPEQDGIVEDWRSEWYKESWCPDLWIDTHLL
jgi:hypothetical protein